MENRVLVAYSSRYGSTREVAHEIADVIRSSGFQVDLRPVNRVSDLRPYGAVVIGSGVYYNSWRREALKFLELHRAALSNMPVWFFSVGIAMRRLTQRDRQSVAELFLRLSNIVPGVSPVDVGMFAGSLDQNSLSFPMKILMKVSGAEFADYRDWNMIRGWGRRVAERLSRIWVEAKAA